MVASAAPATTRQQHLSVAEPATTTAPLHTQPAFWFGFAGASILSMLYLAIFRWAERGRQKDLALRLGDLTAALLITTQGPEVWLAGSSAASRSNRSGAHGPFRCSLFHAGGAGVPRQSDQGLRWRHVHHRPASEGSGHAQVQLQVQLEVFLLGNCMPGPTSAGPHPIERLSAPITPLTKRCIPSLTPGQTTMLHHRSQAEGHQRTRAQAP
jgi:hypothetical protein